MAGWKSGKFMPFTSRSWSLNVYSLSKIWYRSACLDILLGDSTTMTSYMKGWLYQDMILKPQEFMLYRQPELGGIGLINIRIRALAMLIHTFLTLSVNPKFITNNYLQALFKWHVIGDREIVDPGRPPYFSNNFFEIIKEVHLESPLNVRNMSLKQWYKLLLEKGVTHTCPNFSNPPVIIPSKLECQYLNTDLSTTYRISRLYGLSPEQKSFIFKWLQDLLPTRERLHRIGKSQHPNCLHCLDQTDNLLHTFHCSKYLHITGPVLDRIRTHVGHVDSNKLVVFDLQVPESMELPVLW